MGRNYNTRWTTLQLAWLSRLPSLIFPVARNCSSEYSCLVLLMNCVFVCVSYLPFGVCVCPPRLSSISLVDRSRQATRPEARIFCSFLSYLISKHDLCLFSGLLVCVSQWNTLDRMSIIGTTWILVTILTHGTSFASSPSNLFTKLPMCFYLSSCQIVVWLIWPCLSIACGRGNEGDIN